MDRKNFVKNLFGGLLAVPFVPKLIKPTQCDVQTLEHGGWGGNTFDPPISKYVTRWTFASKEEAETFVQSLIPRLVKLVVYKKRDGDIKNLQMDNVLRSGYRGAIRAILPTGIHSMQLEIVSEKADGSWEPCLLDHPQFWSIGTAWGYLANIRINGEPVSRPSAAGRISQYLIEPFIYDRKNSVLEYLDA